MQVNRSQELKSKKKMIALTGMSVLLHHATIMESASTLMVLMSVTVHVDSLEETVQVTMIKMVSSGVRGNF